MKYKLLENEMKSLGYTSSDIEQLINRPSFSKMDEDFLVRTVSNLFKLFTSLDFEIDEIIKISKKVPELFTLGPEHVNQNISCMLKKMKYTKENIKTMITRFPRILYLTEESMTKKMDKMVNLGYDWEQVKTITIDVPQFYACTIEYIEDKDAFYSSIGLHGIFIKSFRSITQSIELSYAIYMFFKSIGIDINMDNSDLLFKSENFFVEEYGKSYTQLMEEYPCNTDAIRRRH